VRLVRLSMELNSQELLPRCSPSACVLVLGGVGVTKRPCTGGGAQRTSKLRTPDSDYPLHEIMATHQDIEAWGFIDANLVGWRPPSL